MKRQRLILGAVAVVFLALSGWIIYRGYRLQKDSFLGGAPPVDVQTALFPEKIPLTRMRPPALRANDPVRYGTAATSSASVVEFGDFDCDACQTQRAALESVIPQYGGRVRLVWRDLPVTDVNPKAMDAAIFARCAGLQGKFWETYDALYDADIPKTESIFTHITRILQLDTGQLAACRASKDVRDAVQQDVDEAKSDGVQSAPFLFIGTKAIIGPIDAATLKQEIDRFLAS